MDRLGIGEVVEMNQPSQPILTAQDYIDIQQLYAAYAWAVDTGDGPGRAAVFTPDGTFTSSNQGNVVQSAAAIAERTSKQGNIGDRHLQYNIRIEPTHEGAKGSCYVLIVRGKASQGGTIAGTLQMYNDTFVKTAAGWRFKTRRIWADSAESSPYRARA
jgi:hypothetical protein